MPLVKKALSFSSLTFDIGKPGNSMRRPNKSEWFLVETGNL
jgi:hypothetical protein